MDVTVYFQACCVYICKNSTNDMFTKMGCTDIILNKGWDYKLRIRWLESRLEKWLFFCRFLGAVVA